MQNAHLNSRTGGYARRINFAWSKPLLILDRHWGACYEALNAISV